MFLLLEPDVSLTDFALALEAAIFAGLMLGQRRRAALAPAIFLFFASLAAAAVAGGVFHGFFGDKSASSWPNILWTATLISIGLTAVAAWRLAGLLLLGPTAARWLTFAAAAGWVVYSLAVLFWSRNFALALVNYLPAAFFLFAAFMVRFAQTLDGKLLLGGGGLALTFVAAAVQHLRIALYPPRLGHNAFYHLLQGVALLLIFLWAWRAAAKPEGMGTPTD